MGSVEDFFFRASFLSIHRNPMAPILLLLAVTLLTPSCTAAASPSPAPYVPTGSVLDQIMTDPDWSLLATAIDKALDPDLLSFLKMPSSSELPPEITVPYQC